MIKGTFVTLPPCFLTITDGCDIPKSSALQSCIFPVAKYRSVAKHFISVLIGWGRYCIPH